MSEPKFKEDQPVLLYGRGSLPVVTRITRIVGWFAARQIVVDRNGGIRRALTAGWFYETENHIANERFLRPIIDPDAERETEQEEDDITA